MQKRNNSKPNSNKHRNMQNKPIINKIVKQIMQGNGKLHQHAKGEKKRQTAAEKSVLTWCCLWVQTGRLNCPGATPPGWRCWLYFTIWDADIPYARLRKCCEFMTLWIWASSKISTTLWLKCEIQHKFPARQFTFQVSFYNFI